MSQSGKPVVAHIATKYYSLTQNWIHTQLEHLHQYCPIVLTWRTENLNGGFVPEYSALSEQSRLISLFERGAKRLLGYYPMFYRQIRTQHAKLLHAHFANLSYRVLPLATASKLPLVTSVYGYDVSRIPKVRPKWRERYQHLFAQGAIFIAEGPHMGKQLCNLGCPAEKVVIHHLGVEVAQYPFVPRDLPKGEPLRLLIVGRFTEKKGIEYAVKATATLLSQGIPARLTIIGDAGSTQENQMAKQRILATIEQYGLAESVELRGRQPLEELRKAYYEHHVYLAPSVEAEDGDNEGGAPVTLIEAAATGMPAVAAAHCDIPEVVEDGITGLLAPERDSDQLAQQVAKLFAAPEWLSSMGRAAHQRMMREYNAVNQGDRLAAIYDTVVEHTKEQRQQISYRR